MPHGRFASAPGRVWHRCPSDCPLTSFGGQALVTAPAAAALLSARTLPVPSAGGAARGRGGRCLLGRGTDARFLWRAGGSGAGGTGGIGGSPRADPQPPELRGDPCPLLPCPVRRRAARTLGRGQADVVAAAQAALLLAGALGIAPTPGSAVVGGEQPGVGRAEAGLPCMARRWVAAVSPRWLRGAAPQPGRPRRSRSPFGTAAPDTLGSAARLCRGSAAAAPLTGTAGLAPDPSAEGHVGYGAEPYRAPQLTGLGHPARPTLVFSAAQPRAPAAAARLPIAAVAVAPAICPLLPGWVGRGDPCEADGWWLHVWPGMQTQRVPRSGRGAVSRSPKPRRIPAALPFHFTRVPVPSLPALLEARPWGPGRAELPKRRGGCRPLTSSMCVTLRAAPLVTAHLRRGTVLVLMAPPLVERLWSGRGRAGVLCAAEQGPAGGTGREEGRMVRWPLPAWLRRPLPTPAPTQESRDGSPAPLCPSRVTAGVPPCPPCHAGSRLKPQPLRQPPALPGSPCEGGRQASPQARGQHLALPGQSLSWAQASRHGRSVSGAGLAGQVPGFTGDSSEKLGTGSSSPAAPPQLPQSPHRRAQSEGVPVVPQLCALGWPRPHGITPRPRSTALPIPSRPVSPTGAGGRHWWPQLLLQHFCASGQSLSPRHRSRHVPDGPDCAAGHSPGLGRSGGAGQTRGFSTHDRLPCASGGPQPLAVAHVRPAPTSRFAGSRGPGAAIPAGPAEPLPCSGSRQATPQRSGQHFCAPRQSLSSRQGKAQG